MVILGFSIIYSRYVPADSKPAFIVTAVIASFFIFHFVIRKNPRFKSYFLSPFNFLSAKYASKTSYDIPIDLMFEKTLEVLDTTKFKLVHADKERFEIFAISPISWKSWGENLYIDFTEENGETIMNFHSVAVMQVQTWDKNQKNSEHLINSIEDSLTI
ncbi:hypothetical protein Oweho_0358 [Owenweeksia hongkongensis DSM 17368]|uniref:Uncharacterized protein n=1 Tax=Owenweeksia hongkongensis (strain DSM 17368 / CIP 108786 / JCM 12287 / NRRL B-23963 / UST20020801) TaxID=926562 RepID=G8R8J7_OWEHD|nr:hypothetical protein Oweho_0358 [Owenweeksia hongkongensis DSM 17368]